VNKRQKEKLRKVGSVRSPGLGQNLGPLNKVLITLLHKDSKGKHDGETAAIKTISAQNEKNTSRHITGIEEKESQKHLCRHLKRRKGQVGKKSNSLGLRGIHFKRTNVDKGSTKREPPKGRQVFTDWGRKRRTSRRWEFADQ